MDIHWRITLTCALSALVCFLIGTLFDYLEREAEKDREEQYAKIFRTSGNIFVVMLGLSILTFFVNMFHLIWTYHQ